MIVLGVRYASKTFLGRAVLQTVWDRLQGSTRQRRWLQAHSVDLDRLKMEFALCASSFIVSSQWTPSIGSTLVDVTVPVSRQCGMTPATHRSSVMSNFIEAYLLTCHTPLNTAVSLTVVGHRLANRHCCLTPAKNQEHGYRQYWTRCRGYDQ